jgi:hypothetical protein
MAVDLPLQLRIPLFSARRSTALRRKIVIDKRRRNPRQKRDVREGVTTAKIEILQTGRRLYIRLRFFSASAKSLYTRFAPPSNGSAPVKRSQKSGLSARGTVIVAPG